MRPNYRTIMFGVLSLVPVFGFAMPPSLSGAYAPPDGQMSITFIPGGTAVLQMNGEAVVSTYRVTGHTVEIAPPRGAGADAQPIRLKIDDNGCLYSDAAGMDPDRRLCHID